MRNSKAYWMCQLLGWSLYGLLGSIISNLYQQGTTQIAQYKLVAFQVSYVALMIFFTHMLRLYMKRKKWLALSLPKLLLRLLPVLMLISMVVQLTLWLVLVYIVRFYSMAQFNFSFFWVYVFYCFIILLLWSAIYVTAALFRQRQQQEVDKWKLEAALKDTELQALKAQINPHFIFNSLNNIRSLIAEDQERARHMVTHLSDLLRYSLQYASQERVTLAKELEVVQSYLQLESVQLEERLNYELHVSEEAMSVEVPPMVLQLLVENAIKHGISQLPQGGKVAIIAEVKAGQLQVEINNTGQLSQAPGAQSLGIGFRNVSERLRLLFGSADLYLLNSSPDTVTASFKVPLPQLA